MAQAPIDIRTPDGTAQAWVYRPVGEGTFPAAVFLMDALGVRPAMHQMAERLAQLGYVVLFPNLFYRSGEFAPFDAKTVWTDEAERNRLMGIMKLLDAAGAMRDMRAYFDALGAEKGAQAQKVGCVGYCMGGRLAMLAAGHLPDRVGAAASFHGGNLVTDQPDSPHLLASKIRASVYLGVADDDRSCTPEHQAQLAQALGAAKVRYAMELYPGAKHGFAMPDFPVYDRDAAERHWVRLAHFFGEALPRGT